MKINAKTATLFSALGLLAGGMVALGAQVHAQSVTTPIATQIPAISPIAAPAYTDNIQDPNDSSAVDQQDPADSKDVPTPGDKPDKAGDNTTNDQERAD